jgi:hypothetical protein
MTSLRHKAGIAVLAAALVASPAAWALEFGEWQVNLADIAVFDEPGHFVGTPSVCSAFWAGERGYLLFALLPGGDRLIQASGRDWNHPDRFGPATVVIGRFTLGLEDAIYGAQFVDHVTSEADGGVAVLETLGEMIGATRDEPQTVQYLDGDGSVLIEAPFEGFLPAIGGLLDCRRVVYGE